MIMDHPIPNIRVCFEGGLTAALFCFADYRFVPLYE